MTDDQNLLSARQISEDRRVAEIEIRSRLVGAVHRSLRRAAAADDEHVDGGDLIGPEHLARVEIERHHRVARVGGGLAVGVAGGDVDDLLVQIDGRR